MISEDISTDRRRILAVTTLLAFQLHIAVLCAVPPPLSNARLPQPVQQGLAVRLEMASEQPGALKPSVSDPAAEPPALAASASEPEPKAALKPLPKPGAMPSKPQQRAKARNFPVKAPASGSAPTSVPGPVSGPATEQAATTSPGIVSPHLNRKPVYPELARKRGQQGTVYLRAQIDAQGKLMEVRVEQSSGFHLLDQAAVKAVRRWRFTPACQAGRAIQGALLIPITFRLREHHLELG